MSTYTEEEMNSGGGDDLLAAEFVLGVLDEDARLRARDRVRREAAFAALVEGWVERLSPLNISYEEVSAPSGILRAVEARLFGDPQTRNRGVIAALWDSILLWRGVGIGSAFAALILAVVYLGAPEPEPTLIAEVEQYAATLAPTEDGASVIALYQGAERRLRLSGLPVTPEAVNDLELWVIVGEAAPVSLGLLPEGDEISLFLDEARAGLLDAATRDGIAVLAISLEPQGGSPTGAPTGPVLSVGQMQRL